MRSERIGLLAVWFLVTLLAASLVGQTQKPALTEVQKLQLQNKAQQIAIARLEMDKARAEFNAMLSTLQVEGYSLDLDKLEYVAKAATDVRKPEGGKQ